MLVAPASVVFDPVELALNPQDQQSNGKTVRITNNSQCAPLVVGLVVASAPDFVLQKTQPAGVTIAAGAFVDIPLWFTPAGIPPSSGMLTITSNDPAHGTVAVPLIGTTIQVDPCVALANSILATKDDILSLQAELQDAAPGAKARIVAAIKKDQATLAQLRKQAAALGCKPVP